MAVHTQPALFNTLTLHMTRAWTRAGTRARARAWTRTRAGTRTRAWTRTGTRTGARAWTSTMAGTTARAGPRAGTRARAGTRVRVVVFRSIQFCSAQNDNSSCFKALYAVRQRLQYYRESPKTR